jgi:hypothetical protein
MSRLPDTVSKQSGHRMVALFRGSYVYEPADSACRSVVGEGPQMGELIEVVALDKKCAAVPRLGGRCCVRVGTPR